MYRHAPRQPTLVLYVCISWYIYSRLILDLYSMSQNCKLSYTSISVYWNNFFIVWCIYVLCDVVNYFILYQIFAITGNYNVPYCLSVCLSLTYTHTLTPTHTHTHTLFRNESISHLIQCGVYLTMWYDAVELTFQLFFFLILFLLSENKYTFIMFISWNNWQWKFSIFQLINQ